MPLARTFDGARITTTIHQAYADRLSRWSDIQEYLPLLHETARSYDKVRVLELGSRKGNSTLAFLAAAEEVNGHVWSGDVTDVTLDSEGMLPWRNNPRWTFVCGDDMDPEIQKWFPREVDVLFIDTSHEYQHTLDEIRDYLPRVAPGGVALFHDTNLQLNISGQNTVIPPVRQALDDSGHSWEDIPGEYGLGKIQL